MDSEDEDAMSCYSDGSTKTSTSVTSMTDVTNEGKGEEKCLKDTRTMTVNALSRITALREQKFTKPRTWPYLLPFTPDAEADEWLNECVRNISALILIDDMSQPLGKEFKMLNNYISKYGLRFKKEQHCQLIKLCFGLMCREKLGDGVLSAVATTLWYLVRGSKLSRDDFILDWKLIFDRFEQYVLKKDVLADSTYVDILSAVRCSTYFFEKGAEKEIWKRIRHYISPASMYTFTSLITIMPSAGFKKGELDAVKDAPLDDFFLPVLWNLYTKEELNDGYSMTYVNYFIRLTKDSPEAVLPFFHQHIPLIFNRFIRSLGLTAREGKVYVALESSTARSTPSYGKWIGLMLGTHPSVETHLMRLFSIVESHMHPSRNGTTVLANVVVSSAVLQLTLQVMNRCRRAALVKLKKNVEQKQNKLPPLSDSTITMLVTHLVKIYTPALHGEVSGVAVTLLGELAFLRPGLVIPKILDQLYPSLDALCEPERLRNSLAALKRTLVLIAGDRVEHVDYDATRQPTKRDWLMERDKEAARLTANELRKSQRRKRKLMKEDKSGQASARKHSLRDTMREETTQKSESELIPSLRPHLVYIAEALLDCIDINDIDKASLAYEVFSILFAVMPIVDCSKGEKDLSGNISEEEHRLIQLTKRLKDIMMKFVDKTFIIIEALATNATNGVETIEGIKDSEAARKQGSDEGVIEKWISQAFGTFFSQMDEEMAKLVSSRVLSFVRSSLLDNSTAAGILANIVVTCVYEYPACLDDYLEYIVNEIGDVVDEEIQSAENVDGHAAWLAAIATGFCYLRVTDVHDNLDDLLDMGKRLLACKNKVMYEAGCGCINALLTSLLSTAPQIDSPDERYKKGRVLPSKLWGATVDQLLEDRVWTHPIKADIDAASKILECTLFEEMRRLKKAEGLSREQLRKSISIVSNFFLTIREFLPSPNADRAPTHHMRATGLPRPPLNLTRAYHQLSPGELTFEGRNVRNAMLEIAEAIVMNDKCCQDSQALENLVYLISVLHKDGISKIMSAAAPLISVLHHSLLKERQMNPVAARDKMISIFNAEPSARRVGTTTFDLRQMRALFKMSFSLYETVRYSARVYLCELLLLHPGTTLLDEFIDEITVALGDSRPEICKAALQLIEGLDLPSNSHMEIRVRIWPLLLKCRRPEDAKLLSLLDECYEKVSGMHLRIKPAPLPESYLTFVKEVLQTTPAAGEWKMVDDLQTLLTDAKTKVDQRKQAIEGMYTSLSATLRASLRSSFSPISPCEKTMEPVKEKNSTSAIPADFDSARTAPSPSSIKKESTAVAVAAKSPTVSAAAVVRPAISPTAAASCSMISAQSPTTTSSPATTARSIDSNKENMIDEFKRRPSSATPSLKSEAVPTISTTTVDTKNAMSTFDITIPSVPTSCRPSDINRALGELFTEVPKTEACINSSAATSPTTALSPVRRPRALSPIGRKRLFTPPAHIPLYLPAVSPRFHIRTADLCAQMILLIENRYATEETMREILLPRLLEERIEQRSSAMDDVKYWMRKNKPKTRREEWACPVKVQGKEPITYGLRVDNASLAYDSQKLPDTEQKWNETRFFSKNKGYFAWPHNNNISVATSSPITSTELKGADKAIVEWFSKKENVHRLLELKLAHLGEANDEMDITFIMMIKYLLRNYPDQAPTKLLPPLREALEKLFSGKHVYETPSKKATVNLELATQRLAAELFIGIARGTKYLPFKVLDDLWKWLAPAVMDSLDRQNFEASHFWGSAFGKVFDTDHRRYWWLLEALIASFDPKKSVAPDERWKPANRLSLIAFSSWRNSETLSRFLSIIFNQLLPMATSDAMRKSISYIIGDAVQVVQNRSEFSEGLPERFNVPSIDKFIMQIGEKAFKISRQASPLMLERFDPSKDKENRRTRKLAAPPPKKEKEEELMRHELLATPQKHTPPKQRLNSTGPRSATLSSGGSRVAGGRGGRRGGGGKGEDVGQEKESMYARVLIEIVYSYFDVTKTGMSEGLMKVLPLLCELATENEAEDADTDRESDIGVDSETLVQTYMACVPLDESTAEKIVDIMEFTMKNSQLLSQRVSAMKFLHVAVLSNIYLFDRLGSKMQTRLHKIVLDAMVDKEIPVRREAGKCLCALLHAGYFQLSEELETQFRSMTNSSSPIEKQAGCLGFSAIIRAFPDQVTRKVVPSLRELCRISSGAAKDVLVQHWATNALRDFRASHRDEWSSDAPAVIGADLIFLIENELSPSYYV